MAHSVRYIKKARKQLLSLPVDVQKRVLENVALLENNPRPDGCKKLQTVDAYRIRVGKYRVVYEIRDEVLIILVVRVAHRREVYQG